MSMLSIRSQFAVHLREARTRAGMSRRTLAALSGVNERSIINYENGINEPPITQAAKLAQALEIRLDDLVGGNALRAPVVATRTPHELLAESIRLQQQVLRTISEQKAPSEETGRPHDGTAHKATSEL